MVGIFLLGEQKRRARKGKRPTQKKKEKYDRRNMGENQITSSVQKISEQVSYKKAIVSFVNELFFLKENSRFFLSLLDE